MEITVKEEPPVDYILLLPSVNEEKTINFDSDLCRELSINIFKIRFPVSSKIPKAFDSYIICRVCEKILSKNANLENHRKKCQKFVCDSCGKVFSVRRYYQNHQKLLKHGEYAEGVSFDCDECSKKFFLSESLKLHKRRIHEEPYLQCDFCGKKFSCRTSLRTHMNIHLKSKCKICHQDVSKKISLQHYRNHFPKRFQCDLCSEMFSSLPKLRAHMRVHPDGAYICELRCRKWFKNVADLLYHRRMHIDIKRYKCLHCNYETKYVYQHALHMKKCKHQTGIKIEPLNMLPQYNSPQNIKYPEIKFLKHDLKLKRFDFVLPFHTYLYQSYTACSICNKVFHETFKIDQHVRYCGKIFKCDFCGVTTKKIFLMRNHMLTHFKTLQFQHEKQIFPYGKHIKHFRLIFKCLTCNKEFKQKIMLTDHIIRNHYKKPAKIFTCSQCNYTSTNRLYIKDHSKSHAKKHNCDTCGRQYQQLFKLLAHQKLKKHGPFAGEKIRRYQCDKCPKSFEKKQLLKDHRSGLHSVEKKFQCDFCGKFWANRKKIGNHMNLHGSKFPCKICGSKFTKDGMKTHIKKIHSDGLFVCILCYKRFPTEEIFLHHTRIHIGRKRFKCFECEYETYSGVFLRLHVRSKHSPIPDWFHKCFYISHYK